MFVSIWSTRMTELRMTMPTSAMPRMATNPMGVFIGSIPAPRRSLHGERPSPSTAASSFAPPQFFSDERTGAALGGDCVERMRAMPSGSIDFILADPPYLVRYRSHDVRRVANHENPRWLHPAFAEMYR